MSTICLPLWFLLLILWLTALAGYCLGLWWIGRPRDDD